MTSEMLVELTTRIANLETELGALKNFQDAYLGFKAGLVTAGVLLECLKPLTPPVDSPETAAYMDGFCSVLNLIAAREGK